MIALYKNLKMCTIKLQKVKCFPNMLLGVNVICSTNNKFCQLFTILETVSLVARKFVFLFSTYVILIRILRKTKAVTRRMLPNLG